MHEGFKYACVQCDYKTAFKGNLNNHVRAMHEGLKYACVQCDFKTAFKGNLNNHVRAIADLRNGLNDSINVREVKLKQERYTEMCLKTEPL